MGENTWIEILAAFGGFFAAITAGASLWRSHKTEDLVKDVKENLIKFQNNILLYIGGTSKTKELVQANMMSEPRTWEAKSPIILTIRGWEIANELGAAKWVEELGPRVEKEIPEKASRLVIQKACFDFAMKKLLEEVDKVSKNMIEEKIFEEAGEPETVLYIYGILMRDAILRKRGLAVPKAKFDGEI